MKRSSYQMKRSISISLLVVIVVVVNVGIKPTKARQQESLLKDSANHVRFNLPEAPEAGKLVLYEVDRGIGCRDASAEEGETLALRDPNLVLHEITYADPYLLRGSE